MANRSYEYRRHKRYVKGIRRIKQDRAEHGDAWIRPGGEAVVVCECFEADAEHGRGRTFARFADTPKYCSCWMCDYNTKNWEKDHSNKVPLPED